MAIKEQIPTNFFYQNPPIFRAIEKLRIEISQNPNGEIFQIIGFIWDEKDFWVMPKVSTKELFDLGVIYHHLKNGQKVYASKLLFNPSSKQFIISPPDFRQVPKGRELIIRNLFRHQDVNIKFLREDDARLWARKYTWGKDDIVKISRPKPGVIV